MMNVVRIVLMMSLIAGAGGTAVRAEEDEQSSGSKTRAEQAVARQEQREEGKAERDAGESTPRAEKEKGDQKTKAGEQKPSLLERLRKLRQSERSGSRTGRRDVDVFIDRDRNGINDRKSKRPTPEVRPDPNKRPQTDIFIDRDGDGISDDRQERPARSPDEKKQPEQKKPAKKSSGKKSK